MIGCRRECLEIVREHALLDRHGLRSFADFMAVEGTPVARKRGRTVVRFTLEERAFYLKRNTWHWGEFWKTLLHLHLPPRSACQEWQGIRAVQRAGIATVPAVAMGEQARFNMEVASFTLTEELYGAIPLEQIIRKEWRIPLRGEPLARKRRLIQAVAQMVRRLHAAGLWHQDLYLGHFLLDREDTLFLIDVQRVRSAPVVPRRYLIKDLAQLAYSAQECGGLTRADRLRFLSVYLGKSRLAGQERGLICRIEAKSAQISRHTVKLLARRRRRGEIT